MGYRLDEIRGQRPSSLFHGPDTDADTLAFMHQQLRAGQSCSVELIYYTKLGQPLWMLTDVQPLRDTQGNLTGYMGIHTDITERKAAEQALQTERDFAHQVMDALGHGLTVTDSSGRFEYVNPAYARLLGLPPEALLGHPPDHFTVPQDHEALRLAREQRNQGKVSTYRTRLKRPDGADLDVLITGAPRWRNGKVEGAIAAIADLTEHQRMVETIERERATLAAALSSMREGFIVLDTERHVRYFNARAGEFLGIDPATILGTDLRHCIGVLAARMVRPEWDADLWEHALATPATPASFGFALRGPPRRDITAQFFPVSQDGGGTSGSAILLLDVTAERDQERVKERFVSMISHELRTPLGVIKGFATTLLRPDISADEAVRRQCLEEIVGASDELRELVDNLLDMSRLTAGTFEIQAVPVRPSFLVRDAVEKLRSTGRAINLRHLGPNHLPAVIADRRRVIQVLTNLIDNALKYGPADGTITLRAERVEQHVVFSISDEGMGIPAAEVPTLFQPFERGTNGLLSGVGGTGLGLSIAKAIVEAHDGCIWAQSPAIGREGLTPPGATFSFSLPAARRTPSPRASVQAPTLEMAKAQRETVYP
jgi:PAS domain S-box-containing protein